MTSKASRMLEYLAEIPAGQKAPLEELHALCCRHLDVMKMQAVDEFREAHRESNIGKGCIRFAAPERDHFDVLRQILQRPAASEAAQC